MSQAQEDGPHEGDGKRPRDEGRCLPPPPLMCNHLKAG